MDLTQYIPSIPDFPKPGIIFRDITGILDNADAFRETCSQLQQRISNLKFDKIAGLESRGFIFGTPVAIASGVPFVPVRKPGKLPRKTISESYDLEYGSATVEIHVDAVKKGDRVVIIDDLIATGGTACAAAHLIEKAGGTVEAILCVIELPALKGREKLAGYRVETLVEFEGE